jgi:hypothetical protein
MPSSRSGFGERISFAGRRLHAKSWNGMFFNPPRSGQWTLVYNATNLVHN